MFAQVTAPTIYTSKQFQRIKDNFDVSFKPFKTKYITIAFNFWSNELNENVFHRVSLVFATL